MFKKICNKCQKTCYSLSAEGRWFCPGCGADLSSQPILTQGSGVANVLPVSSAELKGPDLN